MKLSPSNLKPSETDLLLLLHLILLEALLFEHAPFLQSKEFRQGYNLHKNVSCLRIRSHHSQIVFLRVLPPYGSHQDPSKALANAEARSLFY